MSYYKEHALTYIKDTKDCDMSHLYFDFEKHLKEGEKVLDVGFGSGRDSLYFIKYITLLQLILKILFANTQKVSD